MADENIEKEFVKVVTDKSSSKQGFDPYLMKILKYISDSGEVVSMKGLADEPVFQPISNKIDENISTLESLGFVYRGDDDVSLTAEGDRFLCDKNGSLIRQLQEKMIISVLCNSNEPVCVSNLRQIPPVRLVNIISDFEGRGIVKVVEGGNDILLTTGPEFNYNPASYKKTMIMSEADEYNYAPTYH